MAHPTKFVKIVTPLAFAIALAACGGGGGDEVTFGGGGSGDGTTQVAKTSALVLTASSRQLPSDGSKPVVITAIAKDKNNNAIAGADVVFAVDNDATIDVATDSADGSIKTANLTPGKPANRTLHVTAKSGGTTETIIVDVIGTVVTIDGPDAITLNKDVPFVLKLKDSANKPIAYENVELISKAGNTITTTSSFTTDAIGEIDFTLRGISGGPDTLVAKVLGVEYTKNINVSGDEFVLTGATSEIPINTNEVINFTWEKEGVPQANKPVTFSATRGVIANPQVITDAAGKASLTISSSTAGETVISAISSEGLSTSLTREFIATTPSYLNTQADPTLIAPNGSSTIVAKIRDINDNPVKNKTIDFRIVKGTVNGKLSASTAVTDSLGRASVSYTAGNSSSAKDGIVINTFIHGYPTVTEDSIKLTVGGNALRIVLGHDQLLVPDQVFYIKQFGVIATDSAGNPVKNQKIAFKIIPKRYYKGVLVYNGDGWIRAITARCDSEDFDNDGNLDAGEDVNNSGFLEPTHDATVTGSGVTDENGRIVVEVVYPKNTAWWSDQVIEATTIVDGTEYIESTEFLLPAAAEDVKSENTPPNIHSPYGIWGSCTDSPFDEPPAPPINVNVINAASVMTSLVNEVWYSVTLDGQIIDSNRYTVTVTGATVEYGPNNTFRLHDANPAVDNSGAFININVDGNNIPFFYNDDPAVIPPPPPADTTPPVITLYVNTPPPTVPLNGTYTEPGYTAIDDKDGDVTGSVQVFGTVNTAVAGDYTLTYQVSDSAGNTTSVTRTVTVTP